MEILIICTLVTVLLLGIYLIKFISNQEKGQIEYDPEVVVQVKVITKRKSQGQYKLQQDKFSHHNSSSTYYMTVEVQEGKQLELLIPSTTYHMLNEDDRGLLTMQGSHFKNFEFKWF